MTKIKITPELESDSELIFLILVDGEYLAYVKTKSDAITAMDSIAIAEQKNFTAENTKVLREDTDGKIIISTQSIGYAFNGFVQKVMTIEYKIVSQIKIIESEN